MIKESIRPAQVIQMGSTQVDNHSAYIIAEMACAHDGDFSKAKQLVDVAVTSKADAVQLQFFHAPQNMVKHHRIYPLLEKIEFNREQWAELVQYGRTCGIDVFACAYDMPSLELAIELKVDGIKFNSADLNNFEMIEVVAASSIPFTLGTGASRMDEIGQAISIALAAGSNKFVLMHGMQSFPTAVQQANIRRIPALMTAFDALVGYADHTDADDSFAGEIDLLALGIGACVFEKHYTLDRSQKGTDYQAALNPDELTVYVDRIRTAQNAMGSAIFRNFNNDELKYRTFQKKRIVAAIDMEPGHVLSRNDLLLLRSEDTGGLDAPALEAVIGKKLNYSIKAHQLIKVDFS